MNQVLAQLGSTLDKNRKLLVLLFVAVGLASALLYWLAFVQAANLLDLNREQRLDVSLLHSGGAPLRWRFILAFAVQGFLYWSGYRLAGKLGGKAAWVIVLGGTLASGFVLTFLFPIDAADIFDNILHGRILGVYGANPFTRLIASFPHDPFYPYTAWKWYPSAYGPVWELLAGAAASLAGQGFLANVIVFKLLPGGFLLASSAILIPVLRKIDPSRAPARLLLFAWNPVVLYETWGNGHNDVLLVFWILCAAWALLDRRYTLAVLALVAGTLTKFIPILLVPVAIGVALSNLPGMRRRAFFLAKSLFFSLLLVVSTYSPFWEGLKVLSIERRQRLFTSSLPAVTYQLLIPHLGKEQSASLVSHTVLILVVLFTLWQAYRAGRHRTWPGFIRGSFNILAFYLLVGCLWFQQWYALWLVGLLPLLQPGFARRLALLFAFTALGKQFVYSPILLVPRPKLPQPWLDIWLTLGVFSLAWLYTLYSLKGSNCRFKVLRRRILNPQPPAF